MKRIVMCLLAATLSQSVFARDYNGKLQCFFHVMSKSRPGFLVPVQIADSTNMENTVLGSTVVVDLADASMATVTSVSKTLTNKKVFDGELEFFLAFQYRGNIAAGNLDGLKISLSQRGKNLKGQDKQFAKAEAASGIPSESPTRLTMFSNDNGLLLATVECGLSKK